jgi:uncharacterized protein YkwD
VGPRWRAAWVAAFCLAAFRASGQDIWHESVPVVPNAAHVIPSFLASLGMTGETAPFRLSTPPQAPDWSRLARGIHDETNVVRRNPAAYAQHLQRMLPRFDGKVLERPGRPNLRTEEGAAAVREAIAALKARRPVLPLRHSKGLTGAAADHVRDQGPIGGLEHRGSDHSTPAKRANRRGRWVGAMAENIAYGENPAREVVIQLLVDDGVHDRGHRDNILDPKWTVEGVACGPHRDYQQMCVVDYAAKYVER